MSSEELKPCPFCGGKAERFTLQDEENFGGDVIVCTKCDACSCIVFGEKEGLNEAWNCRAQLAAIQGGMGEVVGFDRNAAYAACPESGCDWGSFYVGWKAAAAQHQRITTAQPAAQDQGEVQRLREALERARDVLQIMRQHEDQPNGYKYPVSLWFPAIDAALAASTGQEVEK